MTESGHAHFFSKPLQLFPLRAAERSPSVAALGFEPIHPTSQRAGVQIEIVGDLRYLEAPIKNQGYSLSFELRCEVSSLP